MVDSLLMQGPGKGTNSPWIWFCPSDAIPMICLSYRAVPEAFVPDSHIRIFLSQQSAEGQLAKQARMVNPGEDGDSLPREGIVGGMARPASTESSSPHTPTTPSNDVISQNQLQQQIQQMVAATQSQSQQLQNVAPPPAHSSSAALDFSTQHGGAAAIQNFQAAATSAAINYSQALTQQPQEAAAQQQPQQQQQQQSDSSGESPSSFNNGQTTAAAPNYNQAHMAGHYGWV